jgi:hypothetical protein
MHVHLILYISSCILGWIDLHGHSAHMAKAAMRYTFEYLLSLEDNDKDKITAQNWITEENKIMDHSDDDNGLLVDTYRPKQTMNKMRKKNDFIVIVGKGTKLVHVIQQQLLDEFHPSIRSLLSRRNTGRLILYENDICKWLEIHKSVR